MMAPIKLEGITLGQKHQSYNKTLFKLLSNTTKENLTEINYDESDVENLLKIDIACQLKLVHYVLEIFRSKDLLYASRAIKHSTWLIVDPKYAHIINPDFIHKELLSSMTTKSYNKLMLHVRKHLKDEQRVDPFYAYYEETNLAKAFKWLPYASLTLIEKTLKKYGKEIPPSIIKRLLKRSDYVLSYCHVFNEDFYEECQTAKQILQYDHVKFIDYIDNVRTYNIPKLSANKTKKIMQKCPEKILNKISKFISKLHIETLAKHITSENMNEFLVSNCDNPYMKPLYKYYNLKYFLKYMNEAERLKLIKLVFIDKKDIQYSTENTLMNNTMLRCLTNMNNEYIWYELMPFDTAFVNLRKIIAYESNPNRKCAMLQTLIACTHKNKNNIHEVLKYYHALHINEPYKYKTRFVCHILKVVNILHLTQPSWKLLNEIFLSMGIYTEFINKKEEEYIDCIILYNSIHEFPVPDVILKKFKFKTFKNIRNQLSKEEETIIFNFLMEFYINKLQELNISESNDFDKIIECLKNVCQLFCDWKKKINDHPKYEQKINKIVVFLKNEGKLKELEHLYQIGKCLHRQILTELLLTNVTEFNYMYALKHKPEMFKGQIKNILCNSKKLPKKQFFIKLQIFWNESLATEFKNTCYKTLCDNRFNNLEQIKIFLTLSSYRETKNFLGKCLPLHTSEYQQSNKDDTYLSARKGVLKMLYICRPQLSIKSLLLQTNRSSFPHVSPTYNFILNNMNYNEMQIFLLQFTNYPIPLQKLTLSIAPIKVRHNDITKLFSEVWISTKNRHIRDIIFKRTYILLCSSKTQSVSEDLWAIMSIFIENLTLNEHKTIYELLSDVNKIPLNVRRPYSEKAINLLKQLPDTSYYKNLIKKLNINNPDMRNILDIEEVLIQQHQDLQNLRNKRYSVYWLPAYLISTKTENLQMKKYNAILLPFLKYVLDKWSIESHVRKNFLNIMERLYECLGNDCENGTILPIAMFSDIQERFEQALPFDENYLLLRSLSLGVSFLKILNASDIINIRDDLSLKTCAEFGTVCNKQLNEDIKKYSPSIYKVFGQALNYLLTKIWLNAKQIINILLGLITDKPQRETFFIVVDLLPRRVFDVNEYNLRSKLIQKLISHSSNEIRMYFKNNFIQL